jgi:hypothetical protein
MIMLSGDMDARIKTVFDALRIPANLDEAGGVGPQGDEDPFYCLLQDDKLISEDSRYYGRTARASNREGAEAQ